MALVIVSEAISTPATFTLALRVTSPTLETTPFTGTLNEPSPSFAMVNSVSGAMLSASSPDMLAATTTFSPPAALLYFTTTAAAADSPFVRVPVNAGFSIVNLPSSWVTITLASWVPFDETR